MNPKKLYLFVIFSVAFIISFLFQNFRWNALGMIDSLMWGHEAQYVLENNPHQFDFINGYGHPGGPIIEGGIVLAHALKMTYEDAVLLFVTAINSLIMGGICCLAYTLRQTPWWWKATALILPLNRLYEYVTPPSAIASTLFVFFALFTWYLHEEKHESHYWKWLAWGATSGALVATRADIGAFSSVAFFLFLFRELPLEKWLKVIFAALAVFFALDPFLWFIPAQHILDLIFKGTTEYALFPPRKIPILSLVEFSTLGGISAFIFAANRKNLPHFPPKNLGRVLLLMAVMLYGLVLSTHSQMERYFMPLLLVWEILLPLMLFTLIDEIQFEFIRTPAGRFRAKTVSKALILFLLFGYHLLYLVEALWISRAFAGIY